MDIAWLPLMIVPRLRATRYGEAGSAFAPAVRAESIGMRLLQIIASRAEPCCPRLSIRAERPRTVRAGVVAAAVEWFASRTDEPLRQRILADLNASLVVEIRDEQLVLRFCVAGYAGPNFPVQKELSIAAEILDADGERLAAVLLLDENSRLLELEVTRRGCSDRARSFCAGSASRSIAEGQTRAGGVVLYFT
jgi:hypothetical protein